MKKGMGFLFVLLGILSFGQEAKAERNNYYEIKSGKVKFYQVSRARLDNVVYETYRILIVEPSRPAMKQYIDLYIDPTKKLATAERKLIELAESSHSNDLGLGIVCDDTIRRSDDSKLGFFPVSNIPGSTQTDRCDLTAISYGVDNP